MTPNHVRASKSYRNGFMMRPPGWSIAKKVLIHSCFSDSVGLLQLKNFDKTVSDSGSHVLCLWCQVPSAPPTIIVANAISSTVIYVSWSSVPHSEQNGLVRGYKVQCLWNGCSSSSNSSSSSTGTPSYLSHHIKPRISTRHLRSSSHLLLPKPPTRTHFADRTFPCTAPTVWNSLNSYTVDSGSLAVF